MKSFARHFAFLDGLGLDQGKISNRMGMVSPEGQFYFTEGLTHPDWAGRNRKLINFVGTQNGDYDPAEGDDAIFDNEGRIALDYFMDAGWIRVEPDSGVELGFLSPYNVDLVKKILRTMAKSNAGRKLYVDIGGRKVIDVPVRATGRPEFERLEEEAEKQEE